MLSLVDDEPRPSQPHTAVAVQACGLSVADFVEVWLVAEGDSAQVLQQALTEQVVLFWLCLELPDKHGFAGAFKPHPNQNIADKPAAY